MAPDQIPARDRPADVVEAQLRRRLAAALAEADLLLGQSSRSAADDATRLADAIAALVARLGEHGDRPAAADQQAHEQQLARLRGRFEERASALEQAQRAVARLRTITAPQAMLADAPRELCESSTLDRVVLSTVRDGLMRAEAVHVRDDPEAARAALAALRARPIALEHPLIETEVLRRRRATVVTDAHVHPRVDRAMATAMRWRSYIAAPIAVRATPIAVIHADRGPTQPLDVLHRDLVWEFAAGLAQAYESASLRRTLRSEREQMRQFLAWVDARSGALSDAAIELVPRELPPLPPREPLGTPAARDDATAFAGVLTRRELEVLRLLTEGRTNRAIADELVISDGTVKFHVNSILRKLRVSNRAEAVSRYYALLGVRSR